MTTTSELSDAIQTSIRENRIVEIAYDGDISACVAALGEHYDGDIDYVRENDGSYDVWGWADETDQDWRLSVRCSE